MIVTSCSRVAHRPAVRLSGLCWGWVKWQLPPTPRAQSPCQPMKSSALSQAATTSPGPFWTSTSLCWWTTRYDCHQTSYVTLLKNLLKFTFSFLRTFFSRWSLLERWVKVEEGHTLSVSFSVGLSDVIVIHLMENLNLNLWNTGTFFIFFLLNSNHSDLNRALANLARATLESVVQERSVVVHLYHLLLLLLLMFGHQNLFI